MKYRGDSFYADNGCDLIYARAVSLDPGKKRVALDTGEELTYDEVCVATGSRPFVPPIEGLDTVDRKFGFMTLDDALALREALTKESRVLIVGAGLIGLKCAEGIRATPPAGGAELTPSPCLIFRSFTTARSRHTTRTADTSRCSDTNAHFRQIPK